jgi:hypothetical protein
LFIFASDNVKISILNLIRVIIFFCAVTDVFF